MPQLVEMIELGEGIEVQWVGVYVLRWQPEWGKPTVGFREISEERIEALLATLPSAEEREG